MQLLQLLHKKIKKELSHIHNKRLDSLFDSCSACLKSNALTLTALGRNISYKNKPRSDIKKVDRLLGNTHLHSERTDFYDFMSLSLISTSIQPWIHIDWSCICAQTNLYLLRASLTMQGRSIVVYEECHPKTKENNHPTHIHFLNNLKNVIGNDVKPIIVTDAGFRAPWFSHLISLGWDFVGRVRNKNYIQFQESNEWLQSLDLYAKANSTPKLLGRASLTKSSQIPGNIIIYKANKKKRRYRSRARSRGESQSSYRKGNQAPWLLITSLESTRLALKVVNIYKQRMRIEENFRDTKSTRYGFGLHESRTACYKRMGVLLLIAAIVTFACWLAAMIIYDNGKASDFQAHSAKNKGVLSSVFLGREALKRKCKIDTEKFLRAFYLIIQNNRLAQRESILSC